MAEIAVSKWKLDCQTKQDSQENDETQRNFILLITASLWADFSLHTVGAALSYCHCDLLLFHIKTSHLHDERRRLLL